MFRKKLVAPVDVEWLIVGLGNPGPEYTGTRHNVGFEVVDALAAAHKIKIDKAKHKSRYGVGQVQGVGVALAKPLTFMNLSGQAVSALLREYKLKPERLLIVADDLDLDLGRIRLKPKGGSGGHNGHKSIKQLIGTEEYPRMKIGIHSNKRDDTIDFVLSKFHSEERQDVKQMIEKSLSGIETLVVDGIERALNVINEGEKS